MLQRIKLVLFSKIKEPSNIYQSDYPLHIVCSIMGVSPYKLQDTPNGRKVFSVSIPGLIKSSIIAICYAILIGINIYFHENTFGRNGDYSFTAKLRYFQEIVASLTCCSGVIFGCIFCRRVITVFKNVDEIDIAFKSLAIWVPYKELYVNMIIYLIWLAIFSVWNTVGVVIVYMTDLYSSATNNKPLLEICYLMMNLLLPVVNTILLELQYVHYLSMVRLRYKILNQYLETLVNERVNYNGWIKDDISKISKTESTPVKKLPKNLMTISDPVFVVNQVASLHIKLTDTAHLINSTFAPQQLLKIGITFVSVVTALFVITVSFSKPNAKEDQLDALFTGWAIMNALEVICMVHVTSVTCEEANTCPRILHRIRNSTTNEELQDTIEIYSLQMFHNRVSFSVCGLFPLDYTLLYTMVAGITTYLVILIQFNPTDFTISSNSTNSTI